MISFPPTASAAEFVWAGGIEDTFVPQALAHQRSLDEYELMGHYEHWREDLALVRASGMSAVRWGVPWYRVEPQQGIFDWSWTDEVIGYMVNELGITPIIDLMHYGCPLWLKDEFANPDYPALVATYAATFAARYKKMVQWYTPLNEPIVNALMCGRRGVWPPYLKGDKGYVRVMMALARGIRRTVEQIRAVHADAMMVHVEATGLPRAADKSLAAVAAFDSEQNFLCYDLITGRVTPEHPLFTWLIRNGASSHDLAALTDTPLVLDVMGLNFYPQWSTQEVYINRQGQLAYRAVEKAGEGFAEMIERYYHRYKVPIMITETSAVGSDEERANWLDASLGAIKSLRAKGIPVMGYTWFPLFTMIDWRYRFGKAPLADYFLELGLYRLNRDRGSRWNASPLVERFRAYVAYSGSSIGELNGVEDIPSAHGAVRERLPLDGTWNFWTDPARRFTHNALRMTESSPITVPAPWQSQSDALRAYSDVAWYQRTFELPVGWQANTVVLGFGAVDYRAEVWLNGQKVGSHEGGYLPFEWEVQSFLQTGTNTITVRVADLPEWFNEIPHGKQSWYGPLSGIWQSVWLEKRSALYVSDFAVVAVLESGEVNVDVTFSAPSASLATIRFAVLDNEGTTVAHQTQTMEAGIAAVASTLHVETPQAWSPDTPTLYRIEIEIVTGGTIVDYAAKLFGFRTIEARNGRFYLNGAPLYLRGALDQDYYPGTIATPPSTEFLEMQLHRAKELGLNCLRCHIKVPDPRYYEVADRLGILIWTELPNWRTLTPKAQELAQQTLEGIVKRDGHHPSIIIWTIVNENWGTNLHQDSEHRAWLKAMYHWLKALDPTRLVVDNSPCIGNFHVESDIEDYHYYHAIPGQQASWEAYVEAMATRTAPTYSPYGDAVRSGKEPIVISEFGNWGLPDVDLLLNDGKEPWWFETGLEFNEAVYPHDVRERYQHWQLDKIFGSWKAFVEATQWHEFYALKAEIEAMRRTPELAGYVITEFTDVHWEANGLLDLHRNPKVFHDAFHTINGEVAVVPRWTRTAYWAGETIEVQWTIAHGGSTALSDVVARYGLGEEEQEVAVGFVAAGDSVIVEMPFLKAPDLSRPVNRALWCELRDGTGAVITRNELPLAFFPRREGPAASPGFWCADSVFGEGLSAAGYTLHPTPDTAEIVVVASLNHDVMALANSGKTVMVMVESADALGDGNVGLRVLPRAGTILQGDWVSSFAWLKREGAFAHIPGGPLLDYSFEAVMPGYVLSGAGPWEYETIVHAGMFVGWIHKVSALLVEQVYGKGKLILTTFRIPPEQIGRDVMVTTLWDALLGLHDTKK